MSERDSSKLSMVTKALYGTGQFVDSVSSTALATFLLFYLTAVCGLSGSLTGASLFVALAVDAFVDPFVGSISDNTSSRWGRRHLFMFASFPAGLVIYYTWNNILSMAQQAYMMKREGVEIHLFKNLSFGRKGA